MTIWCRQSGSAEAMSRSSSSQRTLSAAAPASGAKRSTISLTSGASSSVSLRTWTIRRSAREKCSTFSTRCASRRGLLHDDAERLPRAVLAAGATHLQGLRKEQDLGERGPKLVGYARGEVGAQARELLLPAELSHGDGGEPRGERQQPEKNRQARRGARHHQTPRHRRREPHPHDEGAGAGRRGIAAVGAGAGLRTTPVENPPGGVGDLQPHQVGIRQTAGYRPGQQGVAREYIGKDRRQRARTGDKAVGRERRVVHGIAAVSQRLDPVERQRAGRACFPPQRAVLHALRKRPPARLEQRIAKPAAAGGRASPECGGECSRAEVDQEVEPRAVPGRVAAENGVRRGGESRRRRKRVVG